MTGISNQSFASTEVSGETPDRNCR